MNNIDLINAISSGNIEQANDIFHSKMQDISFETLDVFRAQVNALSVNLKDQKSDGAE